MNEEQRELANIPFNITRIPDCVRRKAEKELGETPENVYQKLEQLKRILSEDNTTCMVPFHDDFLVQYLRVAKFDAQKAFDRIRFGIGLVKKNSFTFGSFPEDYFWSNPWNGILHILPKRCQDGCAVHVFKIGDWDPKALPLKEVKQFSMLIFMQLMRNPVTQINGLKIIYDMNGFSFKHFRLCTPDNVIFYFHAIMKCLPIRWKELHVINDSIFVKLFWPLLRSLLSEKIKKRFLFHSKSEALFNYFPRSVLPKEYGGELDYWDHEDWLKEGNRDQGRFSFGTQPNVY